MKMNELLIEYMNGDLSEKEYQKLIVKEEK